MKSDAGRGCFERRGLIMVMLGTAAVLLFFGALTIGPAAIGFDALVGALFLGDAGIVAIILQEVRLPRAILGITIGATLGMSGAALQGFLRNPLAEPGLIGVSSAAALGAVLAFYTGVASTFALALPLGGIAGGAVAVALMQGLAGRTTGALPLILAGVAVSSLAAALTSLALNLSPNPFAALEIVFWMMGSLADRSLEHVWLAVPFMVFSWLLLLGLGRALDALSLGEDTARSLGIPLTAVRTRLVFGVALGVGAATAVAGAIGFVGLVVPHVLRPLVGHRPRHLLLASALGGACLVLAADLAVRLVTPGRELKLGVLTALLGAPFFFHLVWRLRKETL